MKRNEEICNFHLRLRKSVGSTGSRVESNFESRRPCHEFNLNREVSSIRLLRTPLVNELWKLRQTNEGGRFGKIITNFPSGKFRERRRDASGPFARSLRGESRQHRFRGIFLKVH